MPATQNAGEKKPPRQQLINALGWQIETKVIMHNIQIDNEFKSLIPALSGEERVAVSRYSQGLSVIAAKKLLAQAKSRQQAANKAWIAAARAAFNPGQKQPCKVCGKFQSVAHAHHLTPLYRQIDRKEPDQSFIWLCPTHHHGVHLCIEGSKRGVWPDLSGFSDEEKLAMASVAKLGEKK